MSLNEPINKNFNKSLWDYASNCYALPEVEALSLSLQKQFHANVNIILWCCWLKSEKIQLSSIWLEDVLIKIDSVSQMTVSSLRDVRQQLKHGGNFTKVQIKVVSKQILAAELLIEKILLHKLQDLTGRFLEVNDQQLSENPELLDLKYYLNFLQVPNPGFHAKKLHSLCQIQTA